MLLCPPRKQTAQQHEQGPRECGHQAPSVSVLLEVRSRSVEVWGSLTSYSFPSQYRSGRKDQSLCVSFRDPVTQRKPLLSQGVSHKLQLVLLLQAGTPEHKLTAGKADPADRGAPPKGVFCGCPTSNTLWRAPALQLPGSQGVITQPGL